MRSNNDESHVDGYYSQKFFICVQHLDKNSLVQVWFNSSILLVNESHNDLLHNQKSILSSNKQLLKTPKSVINKCDRY
jgi:hypothetical protein